jgi:hypothetical protein
MIIKPMYIIYDRLAETTLGSPLICENDAVAARAIQSFLKNADAPEEYRLLKIATIDISTGAINPWDPVSDVFVRLPEKSSA